MTVSNAARVVVIILLLSSQAALAQSTNMRDCDNGATSPADNDPERFIGVCHLEDSTSTFTYDNTTAQQGEIPFTVRSCSTWWGETCEHAIPYTATISGDNNGSDFVLRRDRGNQQVAVRLSYASGGSSETLSPGVDGTRLFPGGANGAHNAASITVSLVNPGSNLQNGTYSGAFELSIDQCGSSYTWGQDPEACDGRYSTTQLLNLPFYIEILTRAQIRVSGLDDMYLAGNASGVEGNQTFCVWSTGNALFRLTADSLNGSGQFLLQGVDQLVYSADVEHLPTGRLEALTEGVTSSGSWPGHDSATCQNFAQENMQITIRIGQTALQNAEDTSYTDTLILTVELE